VHVQLPDLALSLIGIRHHASELEQAKDKELHHNFRLDSALSRSLLASALRTHLRSASWWMPRSRATWAMGRPASKTIRAPRSNSSSGYFLFAVMA
jgi:hypothetical protein